VFLTILLNLKNKTMRLLKKNNAHTGIICCTVFLFSILYTGNGLANVYVPNTFTDPVITTLNNATGQINGGTTISLRSALMAADNLGGAHTITLSTGTYNLTQAIPNRQITIGNTNQNITINGNGPSNTIINNTLDANKDRILFINPTGTTNSPVITVNGIRFQNAFLSSDPYGGAAICAGGGSAESLTVTNCTFDNNVLPANAYGGAAICMQVRGNLTVDNCTFTNNVSNDADGGAILVIVFGSTLGTPYSTVSITNSTFTGNQVIFPGAGTANGGAISVSGQGGSNPFAATINNNTFINNSADGVGGAVLVNNGPNVSILQVHYNRFLNNTSAASALSSGLHFAESSGSVNAENNWWGCNSNPVGVSSTAPCNQAGGDVAGGGSLDADPWLQLKTTASPTTICNSTPTTLGNTSNITASFLNNSAGTAIPVANLSELIGLTVTWPAPTLGSLSSQLTTIQANGTATALFTSNGTAGTATVNAQVDNVPSSETSPARANITVNATSVVPSGATGTTTICNGSGTTITVTGGIKGSGASTQWFTGSCGGSLIFTGDALTVSPTSTTNYFVRYNGTCNTTNCATVTVTVNNPSVAPSSISGTTTICNGGNTTLTAVGGTLGTGANYQWGTGAIVGTSPIGGATNSTLTVSPGSNSTYWVRIENTSAPCTGATVGVTQLVTVNMPSVAPSGISGTTTICIGGNSTLTAVGGILGTGANYQWGTGAVVGTSPIGGATNSTLNVTPGSNTTYWVRIENTNAPCTGNTGGITQVVTVLPNNTITLTSAGGTNAQTKCINSAITNITYATTGATGATFSGLPAGVTGSWLSNVATISGTPTVSGNFNYFVTLTGGCGSVSATGTIKVNPLPVVSISPAGPLTICTGTPTTLTASSTCNTFAFSGLLSGTQSVPSNPSTARGVFNGTYNASTNVLTLNVVFEGLTGGNASAAHIHTGAVGINGPVIIPFAGFPASSNGTYSNTFTVPAAEIANFMAGNTYINIHNGGFPGGEIRGQVVNLTSNVYTFSGPMSGTQSVPPNASTGTGSFAGTYNAVSNQLTLNFIFNNLIGGNVSAGHIHTAPTGVNGPVIIPFAGLPVASSGSYTNVFTVPAGEIANFLAGNTYINLHNATFPGGEIRGQIAAPVAVCSGVSYSWTTGATTPVITVSSANTYIVTATDDGCSNTASVVVNATPNNTINLTSGVGTNSQTVIVNTPITNITYTTTGATSATVSGLPAGVTGGWAANVVTISGTPTTTVGSPFNYTITLTGGCGSISANGSITVNTGCAVTGTGTTTPTTCAGGSNGTATITLTGTGAGAPGTYTVDGGGSQPYTSNPFTISGLTAGNHTIVATVTAGGCVSSNILVNVGTTTTFLATYVKTNLTSCSGTQDGSITVTPTGGTAPYTYAWTGITGSGNPATTVYPNPGNVSSISGLNIGFYNVTVTDAGGCGSVVISNIHVQYAFAVYVTNSGSASSSCGNTGSVLLYGNAGVIPYSYALVPGSGMPTPAPGVFQSGNSFTGLAAGPYTGFIKDAGGCVSAKNITVSAVPTVVVNPFAVASSSCNADGSVQVFKSGGVGPYSYALSPGAGPAGTFQTSNYFPGLAAGPYTAYVKDGNGCITSATVTVAQGAALSVTALKTNTSTCVNDGTIQVNATGGVAPYSYSINGGTYQSGNTFNGLGAATYVISVKDFKNCTGSLNVTINLNSIVVTATTIASTTCSSNNGQVQLFRTGGTGPYTYSLDGNTYQGSNSFTGKAAGTYSGFVKDFKGCVGVLNGIIVGPSCPPPPITTNSKNDAVKYATPVLVISGLKISAYPNPANSAFTLMLEGYSSKEKISVAVTDLLGRKVYQAEGTGKQQFNFGKSFRAGIYNVQVIQGSELKSLKLVKE
jgi:hypothetical protein